MNYQEIGRKVKLYYNPDQSHLITAPGSEFKSNAEKAIALAFLQFDTQKSTVKKLLKKEHFTWMETKELVDLIPEIVECLPDEAQKYVLKLLSNQTSVEEVSLKELMGLFHQLSSGEQNLLKSKLTADYALIFDTYLGNITDLQEEILTHPQPQDRYQQLSDYAKKIEATIPSWSEISKDLKIAEQMLKGEDLKFNPEDVALEKEIILKLFKNLLYRLDSKSFDYLTQLKSFLPDLRLVVEELTKEIIDQDDSSKFDFLLSYKFIDKDLTSELLSAQAWKCLNLLIEKDSNKLNAVIAMFFEQAEQLGLEEWFIKGMEFFAHKSINDLAKLPIIQKIALKSSNYPQNKFYARIWDWLQEKLAFNHFSTGVHSFAFHYPKFYQDICELERFNLFYSLRDFRNYIEEVNLTKQSPKQYLHNIVEIIHNRVVKINNLLRQDLGKKFNHVSQKVLTSADCAVLMAYLEKLEETEKCLIKLNTLIQKDSTVMEQLFKTDMNEASFPNLKGFFLGELKVGGLENYQGHGKQIKEILSPLGLIISPEIRKEVDHYISIKNDNNITLDLVESKNFKKILTNQNPRMYEIKNQKNRLDGVIDQIKEQTPTVNLHVNSKIVLNRGLTARSQQTLETSDKRATQYSEAQGVIFNFDELSYVISEETEKLCQLINKKKQFDKELFSDKISAIAHLIAMIEEDGVEPCSDINKGAGNKAKELFNTCSKILSNKLNNSLYYKDVGQSIIFSYRGIVNQREMI